MPLNHWQTHPSTVIDTYHLRHELPQGHYWVNITKVITQEDKAMSTLKLTQIGNSVGVILPKETLARLKLVKGDTVFMTDAVNGVTISPYDTTFDTQMTEARRIMKKRRAVLHELAK